MRIISDYFQEIYTTYAPLANDFEVALCDVPMWVDDQMNCRLLQPFTADEVLLALKQTHPHKTPGPDGLLGSFYKHHWPIIGPYVLATCLSVLNGDCSSGPLNETMIVLIPKVPSPQRVSDY